MAIRIRSEKDFYIGLIYLALGTAGLVMGRNYAFGTPARMGAGFFPIIIASLLVLFGLIASLRGLLVEGEPIGDIDWKGIALITGSVVIFGLLLESLGLPIAIIASGLLAAVASDRFKLDWRALLGLVAFAAFCVLVFVTGLGLPMPLVGEALTGLGF